LHGGRYFLGKKIFTNIIFTVPLSRDDLQVHKMIGYQTVSKMVRNLSGRQRQLAHQMIIQHDMAGLVGAQLLAEVDLSILLKKLSATIC